MNSGAPTVSVIIPVFNDERRLEKCLDALECQTYPKDRYQVVVVDNASTVELKGLIERFPQTIYCYEEKPGSYAARNKGLSVATGDIIAFTDSDCIPASDWIERGVAAVQKFPDCALVGGAIELFFKNPDWPTGVELYESLTGFPQKRYIEEERFGATANVFTCRKIFDSVGDFNAELKSGGDKEWGRRVADAGYQLHYVDDVVVNHPARSTYSEMFKKIVRVMSGLPAFRNPGPVSPSVVIKRLLRGIVSPVARIRRNLAEADGKSVGQKLRLVVVILFIHYIWVFEGARLTLKNRADM